MGMIEWSRVKDKIIKRQEFKLLRRIPKVETEIIKNFTQIVLESMAMIHMLKKWEWVTCRFVGGTHKEK